MVSASCLHKSYTAPFYLVSTKMPPLDHFPLKNLQERPALNGQPLLCLDHGLIFLLQLDFRLVMAATSGTP